ncbi:hypothetical protein Ddc_18566 [Ditylenchus destructor]|nr:hypothetical protein Ddc_18566 [Ditylenchus destructor]
MTSPNFLIDRPECTDPQWGRLDDHPKLPDLGLRATERARGACNGGIAAGSALLPGTQHDVPLHGATAPAAYCLG